MSKDMRREVFRGLGNPIYRYTSGYTDKDNYGATNPPASPISQWFGLRWPRRQTIFIFINMVLMFALLHHLSQLPGQSTIMVNSGSNQAVTSESQPIFTTDAESFHLTGTELQEYLLEKAKNLTKLEFPKKIWQTWKTIALPKEEDYKLTNSWHIFNPGHEYQFLTDNSAEQYVIENFNQTDPYLVHLWRNLRQRILAADLLRYMLAFKSGGLYSDIDTECRVPIEKWLNMATMHVPGVTPGDINIVVGMEVDLLDRDKWSDTWVKDAGFGQRIQFLQWTIYAKPGHEIMRRLITNIQEKIREDIELSISKDVKNLNYKATEILDRTGPYIWTRTIQKYVNDITNRTVAIEEYGGITESKRFGDVLFLPVNRWSPGVPHSNAGPDETSYMIHHFKGNWRNTAADHEA